VVATLKSFYADGGPAFREVAPRRLPPGFLARLGEVFSPSPHQPAAGVAAAKIRALFAPRGLCAECHATVAPADPSSMDYRVAPIHLTRRYLPWGAFDHGVPEHKRDEAGRPSCESCHRVAESIVASDVMLPRIAQCASCHGRTKARTATAASGDCAECHSYHAPGVATPKPGSATAPVAVAGVDPSEHRF
jgi:hypothetical protein